MTGRESDDSDIDDSGGDCDRDNIYHTSLQYNDGSLVNIRFQHKVKFKLSKAHG